MNSYELLLLGLPGCGRSRFANELVKHCEKQGIQPPSCVMDVKDSKAHDKDKRQVWTLIDIRSELNDVDSEAYLQACLTQSSAVVFVFAESSDLSTQSFWQKWLRQHSVELPVLRWFSQSFSAGWDWRELGESIAPDKQALPELALETIEFEVGRLHLEHLLFGLDAAKQNLGMALWRVKGCVQTQEYVNPVAIEGTINRWDTFAGEQVEKKLTVLGRHLDKNLLTEILSASTLT